MARSTPIRVIIVDDHPIVRRGITYALKAFDDIELVGEAKSGEDALGLCGWLKPDVVLMDMVMPGMDGTATTRVLCQRYPNLQVLVLSSFIERDLIQAALKAGARGYLLKDISIDELAQAIRMTHAGHTIFGQAVTQALVAGQDKPAGPPIELTERQREVLALVAAGFSNQRIAQELTISTATARSHVSMILDKLGVANRAEAAAVAVKQNLLMPPENLAVQPANYAAISY